MLTQNMNEIMSPDPVSDTYEAAPLIYKNWLEYHAKEKPTRIYEAGIYTDTRIIGETEVGPCKFLNTLASFKAAPSILTQAIIVRLSCFEIPHAFRPFVKTEDDHYHGGDQFDEIAALVSLSLGIKAQAGNITREFAGNSDPLGNPINIGRKSIIALPPLYDKPIISRPQENCDLQNLKILENLANLTNEEACVVIKVARMYQQALWLADAQPSMSWLLFVSAVETAANSYCKENDKIELSDELVQLIEVHSCNKSITEPLAEYLKNYTGATSKFVKFILDFLPPPPEKRPDAQFCVNFTKSKLRPALRKIYDYRSKALHNGISFPYPMCTPPGIYDEERPMGSTMAQNARWSYEDMPMHLHIFEHIVRGSLINWLHKLSQPK